jgi:two-component system chemotaxis sensor kinase CheA
LWQLYLIHQEQVPSISVALLEAGLLDPAKLAAEESLFLQSIANKKSEAEAVTETSAQFGPAHTLPIDYKALGENAEMIAEFCTEADDHLTTADRHLLELDANPHNKQAVDAIYRGFHTIKGVSSMLGLRAVQMLAHEAENLLNLARDGKILLRARAMDMAFAATDGLKRQFGFVRDWLRHRGLMDQDPLLDQLLKDLRSIDSAEASAPIASAAPLASPAESSGKPAVDPGPVVAPAPLLASSPSPLSAISPSPLATNDDSSGPHARRAGNTEM